MSRLRVRKDGVWVDAVGAILDADTLDGRHADAFQLVENKTDTISSESTTSQYPSAKAVYDYTYALSGNTNVYVAVTQGSDGTYTMDKTFADIVTAINDGQDVIAIWQPGSGSTWLLKLQCYESNAVFFQADVLGQSSLYIRLYSDETVEFTELEYCDNEDTPPSSVSSVLSGNTITVTATYSDGSSSTSTITLDENAYPVTILKGGVETTLTWEGFD